MRKQLGVGIIGASAGRGWAKDSHVPAVQGLDGLSLAAVAGNDAGKAEAAAKAFGAKMGYSSGLALIEDPNVDIVAVAVKVPDHRELVLAAVSAGKHVYCEWPLGRNVDEAKEMADAAAKAGVKTAIGVQLRGNSIVSQARKLISAGKIGSPLSARIVSNTAAFGPTIEEAMRFAEDAENGVTLVTIQGAHTFDLASAVLGAFNSFSALTSTQYPSVTLSGDSQVHRRTTPDHVLLQATLQSGLPISIEVSGGRPPEAPTFFEITGEQGTLTIAGGAMRGVQSGRLNLLLNSEPVNVDQGEITSLPEAALNVGGIYTMLRDDILNGSNTAPNFEHAVQLSRFVADVLSSSERGVRVNHQEWPLY